MEDPLIITIPPIVDAECWVMDYIYKLLSGRGYSREQRVRVLTYLLDRAKNETDNGDPIEHTVD